jgi:hypothetical protein
MLHSRHFGQLSANETRWDRRVPLDADEVRVDLNVASLATLAPDELAKVDELLADLGALDRQGRVALTALVDDDEAEPAKFWRFHAEEVEGYEGLARAGLVEALRLARVGLYPDGAFGSRSYVVLDYELRGPRTDQILAVKLGRDGALVAIAWES